MLQRWFNSVLLMRRQYFCFFDRHIYSICFKKYFFHNLHSVLYILYIIYILYILIRG